MSIRNCKEIGENLQKIVQRLMANDELVNLLYYEDSDPLSKTPLTAAEKQAKIYDKLIKVIPKVGTKFDGKSIVSIRVMSGNRLTGNQEFREVTLGIEVFIPLTSWIIKGTNLRPFAILGAIQESLDNKTVNGLGKLAGGDFELSFLTDEIACYNATYIITTYD